MEWFRDEEGGCLEMRARGLMVDQETGLRFWAPLIVSGWD